MMLVCTSFVSCGGSDDDEDSGKKSEVSNPQYVGAWATDLSSNSTAFIFYTDGKCKKIRYYTSYGPQYNAEVKYGYWSYDDKTSILATTADNDQWTITLSNNTSWAGINISNGKTQSFNKTMYPELFLKGLAWSDGKGNTIDFSNGSSAGLGCWITIANANKVYGNMTIESPTGKGTTIQCKYLLRESNSSTIISSGDLTLSNCYDIQQSQLSLSGKLNLKLSVKL